jgi:hypothetical protein
MYWVQSVLTLALPLALLPFVLVWFWRMFQRFDAARADEASDTVTATSGSAEPEAPRRPAPS